MNIITHTEYCHQLTIHPSIAFVPTALQTWIPINMDHFFLLFPFHFEDFSIFRSLVISNFDQMKWINSFFPIDRINQRTWMELSEWMNECCKTFSTPNYVQCYSNWCQIQKPKIIPKTFSHPLLSICCVPWSQRMRNIFWYCKSRIKFIVQQKSYKSFFFSFSWHCADFWLSFTPQIRICCLLTSKTW